MLSGAYELFELNGFSGAKFEYSGATRERLVRSVAHLERDGGVAGEDDGGSDRKLRYPWW